jgi:hypothetical protein
VSAPTTAQWLRTAVHRIAVGSQRRSLYLASWTIHRSRAVWERARGWLAAGKGLSWALRLAVLLGLAAFLRKIATAIVLGVYHRVEHGGAPWLMWGAALCWIVSAYRAGADGWEPNRPAIPATADEQPGPEPAAADEATPEAAPCALPAPPPVSPVGLIAAVRDIGTPHAQLKPLAEHLGVSTDAVRAAAAGMGWTVKDVRMAGRSASAGLRWDEAPSPAPADPFSGVVGAGQRADDNDDADEEGAEKGVRVVRTNGGLIVYDLTDTHRHHTVDHP